MILWWEVRQGRDGFHICDDCGHLHPQHKRPFMYRAVAEATAKMLNKELDEAAVEKLRQQRANIVGRPISKAEVDAAIENGPKLYSTGGGRRVIRSTRGLA